MVSKNQNAVVIYMDKGDEEILKAAASLVGLSKSALCRTSVLIQARRILQEHATTN